MKITTKIKWLVSLALVSLVIGCTTAKITPAVPATPTTPAIPASTNYIVDPALGTAITTIGAVNDATRAVNPFAPVVDIGLAAALAIAGFIAKRKNDQLNAQTLLTKTVVQAIDAIDQQPVKDAIQTHAARIGVEGELNQFVQRVGSGSL